MAIFQTFGRLPCAAVSSDASAARKPRDRYGLELSAGAEAARRYDQALGRLLTLEDGAEELLSDVVRIDPGFALAHAVLATLVAERGGSREEVRRHVHAARQGAPKSTEREANFVTCAVLWCADGLSGDAALVRHVRTWPTDAYAVSMLAPSISSAGVSDGVVEVWRLLDEIVVHYGDDWWLTSLRAFARTEESRWSEAEDLAASALAVRGDAGHAAHARAHVLYETGRHGEAVGWLDDWLSGDGASQQFRGHFAWHAALTELARGDVVAVRRRFDRDLVGLDGNRLLIDAGSLVARAAVQGRPLGASRTRAVSATAKVACREAPSPFVAWNAAMVAGLVADTEGLVALEERARCAVEARPPNAGAWRQVSTVCRALLAVVRDEPALAAGLLGSLGDTSPLGGSPAQRELIEDLALRCLVAAGDPEPAARLAAQRLARRPSAFDVEVCRSAPSLARTPIVL